MAGGNDDGLSELKFTSGLTDNYGPGSYPWALVDEVRNRINKAPAEYNNREELIQYVISALNTPFDQDDDQ